MTLSENTGQCVVLVTGGSGFLGQHVVGLLQTRAKHVTEVRVLDAVHYINQLDYVHTKPVRSFIGDINNKQLLKNACRGVSSVFHLAAIADASMFPNTEAINKVNVQGTKSVLEAALGTAGVRRLLFSSSMSAAITTDRGVLNGNEDDCSQYTSLLFDPYASSKVTAERLVIAANGPTFRTVCLRPVLMYGELDNTYIPVVLNVASKLGGTIYQPNCGSVQHQHAYVGNVAWAFVCAERSLYEEMRAEMEVTSPRKESRNLVVKRTLKTPQLVTSEEKDEDKLDYKQIQSSDLNNREHIYFIADNTPSLNMFMFQEPFLNACGFNVSRFKCPYILVLVPIYIVFFILRLLRYFGLYLNFPVAVQSVLHMNRNCVFDDGKARRKFGYSPLFSWDECLNRSVKYYKTLKSSNN